jgi:hypothetical protein
MGRRGKKPLSELLMRERMISEYLSERGSKGGKTAAANMTAERRHERAKKAVAAREAKRRKAKKTI